MCGIHWTLVWHKHWCSVQWHLLMCLCYCTNLVPLGQLNTFSAEDPFIGGDNLTERGDHSDPRQPIVHCIVTHACIGDCIRLWCSWYHIAVIVVLCAIHIVHTRISVSVQISSYWLCLIRWIGRATSMLNLCKREYIVRHWCQPNYICVLVVFVCLCICISICVC